MIRTTLVFLTTLISTIFAGLLVIPIGILNPYHPWIDAIIQVWCWLLLKAAGVKLIVHGREHIPKNQPCIFISNHSSHLDVPSVYRALQIRNLRMIAKKELAKIPFFGWGMKATGFILIDRFDHEKAVGSLDEASTKLRSGISIAVFPEGTRSPDGEIKSFKKGGFILALKSGLPIIPISISGSRNILPKKALTIQPGVIQIVIGEPVDTSLYSFDRRNELIEKIRSLIIRNQISPAYSANRL